MIMSYEGAADKELRRDLEAKLRPHISYLTECRPMSVSMRNAINSVTTTPLYDMLLTYLLVIFNPADDHELRGSSG